MKKRIFLIIAMIALLVCAFAVSVSAAYDKTEVFKATDGTDLALYDADGNALAWFYDSSTSKYVSYRVGTDFTMSLNGGKELLPTTAISDTDSNADTTFPYTVSDMILLNGRDYTSFTYISGSWKELSIQAIYVNNSFRYINKSSFNGNKTLRVFDIPKDTQTQLHFGGFAFANSALESIYIPVNSYFEGTSTFEYSLSLKSAEFHEQWTGALKGYEFNGCTAFESIKIPSTVTQIPTRFCYKTALTEVTIPSLVTSIGDSAFTDCKIESVVIPSGITKIGSLAFAGNKNLKELTFVTPTGTDIVIGDAAFESCEALTELAIPEGVTTLGFRAFKGCKSLKKVTFPTTLTTLTNVEQFSGAASLEQVIGLENTQITSIPNGMFFGAVKWADFVKLPNTVTSIGQHAFADAGIKGIILGAGFTTFSGTQAFINCPNLAVVYVPETITSFGTGSFDNGKRTDILFFVTSTDSAYLESVKSNFSCADVVPYDTYLADTSAYATGRHVISGYNKCEAFYNGVHTPDSEKSNACVIICSVCNDKVINHDENAEISVKIEYADYTQVGYKTTFCTNTGCTYGASEELEALFTCQGYSTSTTAVGGIVVGYKVNNEAVSAYTSFTGKTLKFGVFAATKDKLDGNDIFASDGSVNENAICAEIKRTDFSAFDIKIVGFADEQKNTLFAMGAYVEVSNGDVTEYSYMQATDKGTKIGNYYFVSYNNVVGNQA